MGNAVVVGILADAEERIVAIRRLKQIKRNLRDFSNPFLLDQEYFRKHYRLTPHVAVRLINRLHDDIVGFRNTAIPVHLQVLATIRFLAEGSFQKGCASDFNHTISQASMSRCIKRVINAIIRIGPEFIVFPNTPEERRRVSRRFLEYNRIQNLIGLIDCFKVAFRRPPQNEEAFFNHQVGTAMNVQVVCDADTIIRNIRICPGSATDAFIWQFSEVQQEMQRLRSNVDVTQNEGRYYILGDNGYTCSPYVLTPIISAPEGSPEAAYTEEHVSTRCKVEQCFGILTHVWLGISRSRKLFYSPEKVAKIITACAILHNYRKLNGFFDVGPYQQPGNEQDHQAAHQDNLYQAGLQERNNIINRYYS